MVTLPTFMLYDRATSLMMPVPIPSESYGFTAVTLHLKLVLTYSAVPMTVIK